MVPSGLRTSDARVARPSVVACALACALLAAWRPLAGGEADRLVLRKDDHVAIIGGGLADRLQLDGWLETLLYHAHPQHDLVIRNLAQAADEIVPKLRTETGGTRDQWLARIKADVVLAFYGFNESFAGAAGLDKFKQDLDAFLKGLRKSEAGRPAPRVALFSPIAHEAVADPDRPDAAANNRNLAAYTAAMAAVAQANQVPFVDLFAASQKLYAAAAAVAPLTINGVHLTAEGNRALAPLVVQAAIAAPAAAPGPALEALRAAVLDKASAWRDRFRTVDSYNIFGGRSKVSYESGKGGPKVTNAEVMLIEMAQRDQMVANREARVWAVAKGGDAKVDDGNVPPAKTIKTNLPGAGPDGAHIYPSGKDAIAQMTLAKGCKANLFASEERFPELVNPVQMAWDAKGRLWVAVWPNYPERTPTSRDGDKLIVLEDGDGDGVADRCTTFVDDLNCPTGFTFFRDGVLVMRSPDLLFLRDSDGDGKADRREHVLMGLDAGDSHHSTNSMALDPGGATYLSDGVFHRTQVETAAGPVRNSDGASYRYEPRTHRFEIYTPYAWTNPHGRVFDAWGVDLLTDGTGNNNVYGPAISGRLEYPNKHPAIKSFWLRPSRPCPGTGILSSRHFPADFDGNFLNCNVIGMQGVFRVKLGEDGAGVKGETLEHLVMSKDRTFRPTGVSVGPDGAVYVIDWCNAIIGHLQHHLRDPNRDHRHGRVYRITYEGRPLSKPPRIDGQPLPALLDALKESEDGVRLRAKLELGTRPTPEVMAALDRWVAGLDGKDPASQHHLLEALWVKQWHNVVDQVLLNRLLRSSDHRARAAATRVLCYWRDRVPAAPALLRLQAGDDHPRVRLEAVRAASFLSGKDLPAAYDVAYASLRRPSDFWLDYVYRETIRQLKLLSKEQPMPSDPELLALVQKQGKAGAAPPVEEKRHGPTRKLADRDLTAYELGRTVYHREAHCVTCHQADGKGLAPVYPPLTSREWVAGSDERLIKLVLKGLNGVAVIDGKRYDPANGTPPMTPFGEMLNDDELAAVLTYVRQSFGNDFDPIRPEAVARVRAAVKDKAGVYEIGELMKEHPLPGWETWGTAKP